MYMTLANIRMITPNRITKGQTVLINDVVKRRYPAKKSKMVKTFISYIHMILIAIAAAKMM